MNWSLLALTIASMLFSACTNETIVPVSRFNSNGSRKSGLYRTLDGVYNNLNQFHEKYPDLVQLFEIGRSASGKYPLPMVRLHFANAEVKKRYLIVAGTHGDEAAAVEAILFTMEKLTAESIWGKLETEQVVVDIIPLHNPDGYSKNERENNLNIDLNRNFPIGFSERIIQPETRALIDLIDHVQYNASLFFHSANEEKYENLIRVPVELGARGSSVLVRECKEDINRLSKIVEKAGNEGKPTIPWHIASDQVDLSGIASDWCVSGYINPGNKDIVQTFCTKSHPSLTIELCYPKQPMTEKKLSSEEEESYRIVSAVLRTY